MPQKDRRIGRFGNTLKIEQVSDSCTDLGILKIYKFSTAITTGVTAVPADSAVGDLAVTTNATGGSSLFKNVAGVWTAV